MSEFSSRPAISDTRIRTLIVDDPIVIGSSNYATYAGATVILQAGGSITFADEDIPDIWMIIDNHSGASATIESLNYGIANKNSHSAVSDNGSAMIYVMNTLNSLRLIGETE